MTAPLANERLLRKLLVFNLRPGRLCLDMVATKADWTGIGFERVATPERLALWLAAVRLPPLAAPPDTADLAAFHRLRDSVYRR
ncbi:ABATE domain-containing protein [Sphaerisporangium sp. NPDC051011]|uniref:ABATE domain-containing protein n=1 Tax=Sphaerisporangium sp. NPDC051011 TaxID=3155792 RepID=UPI0033CC89DE